MEEPTKLRPRRFRRPSWPEAVREAGRSDERYGATVRDGIGKTREMSKRLERAKAGWTRSAISIQASGLVNGRIKQAGHTEAPEPARPTLETPLASEGASTHGHWDHAEK